MASLISDHTGSKKVFLWYFVCQQELKKKMQSRVFFAQTFHVTPRKSVNVVVDVCKDDVTREASAFHFTEYWAYNRC